MFTRNELLTYQNKLYYVFRKVNENNAKEEIRNELREYWNCDLVLKYKKDPENLWFLREIPEAEIVE